MKTARAGLMFGRFGVRLTHLCHELRERDVGQMLPPDWETRHGTAVVARPIPNAVRRAADDSTCLSAWVTRLETCAGASHPAPTASRSVSPQPAGAWPVLHRRVGDIEFLSTGRGCLSRLHFRRKCMGCHSGRPRSQAHRDPDHLRRGHVGEDRQRESRLHRHHDRQVYNQALGLLRAGRFRTVVFADAGRRTSWSRGPEEPSQGPLALPRPGGMVSAADSGRRRRIRRHHPPVRHGIGRTRRRRSCPESRATRRTARSSRSASRSARVATPSRSTSRTGSDRRWRRLRGAARRTSGTSASTSTGSSSDGASPGGSPRRSGCDPV